MQAEAAGRAFPVRRVLEAQVVAVKEAAQPQIVPEQPGLLIPVAVAVVDLEKI
jgi:hypothetical protein